MPELVTLDNRGAPCAVGLIRAAKKIDELAPGAILEILSKDRFAPMEVPLWAERDGHEIILQEQEGSWKGKYWRFQIRKGTT